MSNIPVIAIDGPSASGKGTIAQLVATKLGFHYLDSGALYRLVALQAIHAGAFLKDKDVSDAIREEQCGIRASELAAYPSVRTALITRQRAFRQSPGLVTDGRDMGSVIFPDAILKIFLTASAEVRAKRRYNQLMEKGINANMATLLQDIQARDTRDSQRSVAPLQHNMDAKILDTTDLNIAEVTNAVLQWYAEIGGARV